MYELTPIPALQTNYIWTITSPLHPGQAVIVDPGEAEPILRHLQQAQLTLAAIIVTHHHYDHTDGINAVLEAHPCPVYAGAKEPIERVTHPIADGQTFTIPALDLSLSGIHVPGHTNGHTAFYGHEMLFTGDTLFAAGCGRNFEGTADELYQSLLKFTQLPKETLIFCGHEYTLQNLTFGQQVEPDNVNIQSKLNLVQIMHSEQQCTLPTNLAEELDTNVFLRCHLPSVLAAAECHSGQSLAEASDVFAILRDWKNRF